MHHNYVERVKLLAFASLWSPKSRNTNNLQTFFLLSAFKEGSYVQCLIVHLSILFNCPSSSNPIASFDIFFWSFSFSFLLRLEFLVELNIIVERQMLSCRETSEDRLISNRRIKKSNHRIIELPALNTTFVAF